MTDVLLAHSFFLRLDAKQVRKMRPYPPLGTLSAAAILREAGHEVALFDAMLASDEEAFDERLAETNPRFVALLEDNFNFLTKMCLARMRQAAFRMIGASKARGVTVIANGSDAADRVEDFLDAGVDVVVIGETERTLPELLGVLDRRDDPAAVAGIAFRRDGKTVRTPARPVVADLDSLPLPAWDLVDGHAYREAWMGAHGRFSLNLVASRGCPFRCNWCAKPNYGTRYAVRSPGNVVREMELLRELLRPDHIWFADDIFGMSPDWTVEFGSAVEKAGIRIPFMMQSRVDLMTPPAVAALAVAGAEEVWLGVESGSQAILDSMEKGTRVQQVSEATRRLRARGIRACWFLQFGYPGEEWADIRKTIELVRADRPDDIGVSVAYPLPGTSFYERVRGQIGAKTNWDHSDDLAMVFRGTFVPEFYRALARALHHEVDLAHEMAAGRGQGLHGRFEALLDEWTEVGRLEAGGRNADPTRLAPASPTPAGISA